MYYTYYTSKTYNLLTNNLSLTNQEANTSLS